MSRNITDLHPLLQGKIAQLKTACEAQGIYIGISECLRTVAEQDTLYAKGRTTPGSIVTNCKGSTYSSMHMWGVAFDFYLKMDVDGDGDIADDAFNNSTGLFDSVGAIGQSIDLEWGGAWKSIKDRPHFQLPDWGSTTAKLKEQYGTPEAFIMTWNTGESTASSTIAENSPVIMSHKYIIGLLQSALNKELGAGLEVDYMQGKKTFSACPTLNTSCKNKYPETIEAYQLLMNEAGYLTSGHDGCFGNGCKQDTKNYQSTVVGMRSPDGEATRMRKTWSHLLRLS